MSVYRSSMEQTKPKSKTEMRKVVLLRNYFVHLFVCLYCCSFFFFLVFLFLFLLSFFMYGE